MSSIERTMRILEMVADAPDGLRVTDLAVALNLNRAIPHRLLAELVNLGYVIQNPSTERYRATFRLGSLGLRQLEAAGVTRWAQDELEALAKHTSELVRLTVATGDELRFVAKAQGAYTTLIVDPTSGADVVLHATASGKAWLSTLPDEQVEELLTHRGLGAQTSRTATDVGRVLGEVQAARSAGYALAIEEMETGVNAIATPIVPAARASDRAVGTVSIAGPAVRMTPEVLRDFAPVLRQTAAALAAQWHVYGYLVDLSRAASTTGNGA